MPQRPKPSAVVFAKDVANLTRCYREVAGMAEAHRDKGHVVLDDGSFQRVIHGIPKKVAAQSQITTPPQVREDSALKVCLPVLAIDQARQKAAEFAGQVGPKSKEWGARGFRTCDGHDPEGNVFQVRESAAEGGAP